MDWSSLFIMQKNLDQYIEDNHDLTAADLFQEKCLALLVELGELANETRCFKFWSKKSSSPKEKILEEYVDGIHFIMSLGLEKGFEYKTKSISNLNYNLTEQFTVVFESCLTFKNNPSQKTYASLFNAYLQLGQLLEISEEELQQAYTKKNEKNYERQNEGY
ncbi:MAG TPA: dUTP diphosphatase [Candidatus Avamphibacillus sp.]|nr:dUTP diphosphatase [Candidatus Avamphibacillus sp.]